MKKNQSKKKKNKQIFCIDIEIIYRQSFYVRGDHVHFTSKQFSAQNLLRLNKMLLISMQNVIQIFFYSFLCYSKAFRFFFLALYLSLSPNFICHNKAIPEEQYCLPIQFQNRFTKVFNKVEIK